ncbi:TonB-dependent receptor domain-containing protein [Caulobacter sp. ErkDOM-E]|uniref:TonB-dependent receptor domain-containing protein n=1 Tax=Caulobacter sp. ErkDOM-E TaxID=3402778 RepID=UPI003AF61ED0
MSSFFVIAFFGVISDQAASPGPAPAAVEKTSTTVDSVTINGLTSNISTRIDRQVYSLRNDPQLQASPLVEVLAKLPSITLTANGELTLLGVPGVIVLVDGKPVADLQGLLRSPGSARVDRVEILTNPPAEFAAQGVGGVINIITHHSFIDGLSGTIDSAANTWGSAELSVSPNWSAGRWALSGSVRATTDRPESQDTRAREVFGVANGALAERSKTATNTRGLSVQAQGGYDVGDTTKLAFGGESNRTRGHHLTDTDIDAENIVLSGHEQTKRKMRFDIDAATLGFERTGPREEERLTADWTWSRLQSDNDTLITQHLLSGQAATSLANETTNDDTALNAKYERPLWSQASLSAGVGLEHSGRSVRQSLTALLGEPVGLPGEQRMSGSRDVASAYGSTQFKLGRWTMLPGIRLERETFEISTSGPKTTGGRTDLFPSLFVRRALNKTVNLNLSYTARISRPDITSFDPQLVYSTATQASAGNPDLKPELIDAFEARIEYKKNASTLNLTGYRKLSRNVLAQDYRVVDDVTVSMPINAGRQDSWGADLNLQRRLSSRVELTATGNLYKRTLDQGIHGPFGGSWWGYSGSLQFEYKMPVRRGREGDTYLVTARYTGPIETPQTRSDSFYKIDAVWRRALSSKATLVVTIDDLFDSTRYRKVIASSAAREELRTRNPAPLFRVALSRRFGPDN